MRTFPAGPELLDPYPFFAGMRQQPPGRVRRARDLLVGVSPRRRGRRARRPEPAAPEAVPGHFLHGVVRLPLQFRAG
jgi:hypothetical protein